METTKPQTTLRALLAVAELRLRSVTGDTESLDRPVRWAHTTELLDPRAYLRGQELVCTVGASLTDAESCMSFAMALIDAGAAGVCFGVGDIHDDVPQGLIQACRGRLPLIAAPLGVPFLAIAEYLADRRVDDAEQAQRRERVGQLLLLVGDRLANPLALQPMLAETGLSDCSLVVSAWQADAVLPLALHLQDGLIGEAPGVTLALTRRPDLIVAAAQQLTLPCGYSQQTDLGALAPAVAQARAALEIALRHGGAVGPGALTSLEGLLEQQPMERLLLFVDQLITPLLAADSQHGTNQLQTLRTFLRLDGSLQATAKSQFLHVNTVRHRLGRIHQTTGRDPLVFADRAALAIALWAFDRRQTRRAS